MTVDEMVNRITRKGGWLDDKSRALCGEFVRERFAMLWDRRLWDDAKDWFKIAVEAEQQDVSMPAHVLLVTACRLGELTLDPVQTETLIRLDPEAFDRIGYPARFIQAGLDGDGHRRIQLMSAPQVASDLLVTAKIKPPVLAGGDTPPLTGSVTALLAYAEADMLEKARQYGKAAAKIAEGESHMQTMIDNEERQQARNSQIIPAPSGDWDRDDIFGGF